MLLSPRQSVETLRGGTEDTRDELTNDGTAAETGTSPPQVAGNSNMTENNEESLEPQTRPGSQGDVPASVQDQVVVTSQPAVDATALTTPNVELQDTGDHLQAVPHTSAPAPEEGQDLAWAVWNRFTPGSSLLQDSKEHELPASDTTVTGDGEPGRTSPPSYQTFMMFDRSTPSPAFIDIGLYSELWDEANTIDLGNVSGMVPHHLRFGREGVSPVGPRLTSASNQVKRPEDAVVPLPSSSIHEPLFPHPPPPPIGSIAGSSAGSQSTTRSKKTVRWDLATTDTSRQEPRREAEGSSALKKHVAEDPTSHEREPRSELQQKEPQTNIEAKAAVKSVEALTTSSQPLETQVPEIDIWPLYAKHALNEDKETVQAWNSDIDSILIFAALFSAVLTTLVVESYGNLQPDPQIELMRAILMQLQQNGDGSNQVQMPVPAFTLTGSAIRVNVYWFSSLIVSLSTAFLGILAKQWVNNLVAGLSPIPSLQSRHRQYRTDGLHKWKLPAVLSFLPLLLHVALLLFFAGLVDFVWDVNTGIAVVCAVLVIATFLVYVTTNVLSYIYPDCPFKTSVTVAISLLHELVMILGADLAYRSRSALEHITTVFRHLFNTIRMHQSAGRRTLRTVLQDLRQSRGLDEDEKRQFSSLVQFSSLRYQDEKFVSQHESLMDARVLVWLVHNADRLYLTHDLGYAIIRFPHLIRYRQMLTQDGVFAFLEKLFKASCTLPYHELSLEGCQQVSAVVGALAALVSEAEVDAVEYTESVPAGAVVENTPFLRVQLPPYSFKPTLNSDSLQLVSRLLDEAETLPLVLLSSILRLSVCSNAEGNAQSPPSTPLGGNKAVETFVKRLVNTKFRPADNADLSHSVNTVVFVSLSDLSRHAQRSRMLPAVATVTSASGDVQYWTTVLMNILLRHAAVLDDTARRQLSWGLCALAWTRSPQANGAVVKPLLPRLNSSHNIASALVGLLSCAQDAEVLDSAMVSVEAVLWNVDPQRPGWEDHAELCRALHSSYGDFLAEFYQRTVDGRFPESRLARLLVCLVRISAYLSFFDPAASEDAKAPLTATTFSILKHVVESHSPARKDPILEAASGGAGKAKAAAAGVLDWATRRWIYRAACQVVILYLGNVPRLRIDTTGPSSPESLIFPDNSHSAIASDLARSLKFIGDPSKSPVDLLRHPPLQPYTLETFCSILRDVFTRAMPSTGWLSPSEAWDAEAFKMVIDLVGSQNILRTLLDTRDACVYVNLLAPAVHCIYKTFFPDPPPEGSRPRIRSPADNAGQMARALRDTYLPFLDRLVDELGGGMHPGRELHEMLVELIGTTGHLAFYDRPAELPTATQLHALLAYLHALADTRDSAAALALWPHAWGTLGALPTQYLAPQGTLAAERAPAAHFRHDRAEPTRMAARLLRIFDVGYAAMHGARAAYHCAACAGGEFALDEAEGMPVELAESALGMILHLWDAPDPDAREVQRQLMVHGLASRVAFMSVIPGGIGSMADKVVELTKKTVDKPENPAPSRRQTL